MSALRKLANGESFIYIVSRVFDLSEKIKAENVERAVIKGAMRAMQETGIMPYSSAPITFVPYRDTVQKEPQNQSPNQKQSLTQKIYLEDIARLHRLFALVGFFDGLSKDEGICMELGYAFGIHKPIILVISDFIRSSYKGVINSEHLVDPIIEAMLYKIIYQYTIPESKGSFKERLQEALEVIFMNIEDEVYLLGLDLSRENERDEQYLKELPTKYDVYIDFGGGQFEWQRMLQEQLALSLRGIGLSCSTSNRYYYHINYNNYLPIRQLGWQDINKAQSSKVVITCSDSLEMSSGTAAIQGFSRALGKKILLYDSKTTNIVGDNNYLSSRNLMIDCSADKVVYKFDNIIGEVKDLLV